MSEYIRPDSESLDATADAAIDAVDMLERIAIAVEAIAEELRISRLRQTDDVNLTDEERAALRAFLTVRTDGNG